MRTTAIAAAIVFAFGGASAPAASISNLERQRLAAHLEMTGSWLADEVSKLSPAQLRFRPAAGVWSVIDVVEHLTIAEPIYWQQLRAAVTGPPNEKKGQATDADVLWYGIDRTERQKTEAVKEPKEKLRDVRAGLEAFHKLHAEMLAYARTTNDDLRGSFIKEEGVDAYQWLLGISTHAQRHILQIREIKANSAFPKK